MSINGNLGSSAKRDDWEVFFDRNLKAAREKNKINAYESFMKYGQNKYFWNEYIFEDVEIYDNHHATTILIPDKYDEFNHETYVKKIYKQIFEEQLESWMADSIVWPKKRDYKIFKKWFDVLCSDMTWDYGDWELEHDED